MDELAVTKGMARKNDLNKETRRSRALVVTAKNENAEHIDDDDDGETDTSHLLSNILVRPPWEERTRQPSPGKRKGVKDITKLGTNEERGREIESVSLNSAPRVRTSSRDSSSSMVTFQLQQQQNQETTSHYTDNTDRNSHFTSESSEGFSFPSERQHRQRVVEINSASGSSGVSVVSAILPDDQHLPDPTAAFNFAIEHRIFIKASLDLLTELDRHAPELGMMDPIVLKAGALKKASHLMNGVWKVKYVEIRRGMFSYYENAVSNTGSRVGGDPQGELLLRKNIPLEASSCTCRAVKLHQKALNFSPGGAIFELTCSNNSNIKRLWMAASREERQAWMQAINNAMVGGSVTQGDSVADHRGIVRTVSGRSPFKTDLRMFLRQQSSMRTARTMLEYVSSLRELYNHSLHVPVKWVAKQVMLTGENVPNSGCTSPSAFQENAVALSVDQLWRDLLRDSIRINGDVIQGDSHHGPERILAALTRCILRVGRNSDPSVVRSDLRESKALVYARDVLLAGNRTRSGGDSYYCVNTLCSNPDLVVVVPSGAAVEPVAIDVSEDESDEALHTRLNDKSGWVRTRTKLQRSWRKHFFVLSEGTLSYYQGATPRPHGLRGQRVLTDASIAISKRKTKENGKITNNDEFVLSISLKDGTTKDRLLLFESEDKLIDWVYALECVTKTKLPTESSRKAQRRRTSCNEETMLASCMADVLNGAQKSTIEHAIKLGLDIERVTDRLASFATQTMSAVHVSVSACTEYNVCTTNPQGDIDEDTWATIQAHFLQAFTITGGPNGRIRRGEEIVRLSVVNCLEPSSQQFGSTDFTLSPSTMRARINRRIFRNPSVDDDGEGPGIVSD